MIRFFLILVILCIAMIVGLYIPQTAEMLTITTKNWHLETPLWFAVCGLLISFFAFHLLCIVLRTFLQIPTLLKTFMKTQQQQYATARTQQGLIALAEGYWQKAKKYLITGLSHTNQPLVNYLTIAYTAQICSDWTLRDHYLHQAQQCIPHAKIAIKLIQAQLQIKAQQWEEAYLTLQHLYHQYPKHPYVLKHLAQLDEIRQDWSALLTLLPQMKKNLTAIQFENFSKNSYLHALHALCQKHLPLDSITHFFQSLPKSYKTDPAFVLLFTQALMQNQAWQEANVLLKKVLSMTLNDDLLAYYAELPVEEDKLRFIQTLLQQHPQSSCLHYCAGLLYFQSRLFGQAKLHFETSLTTSAHPKTYFYLAQTCEALNLREEAYQMLRKGLQCCINIEKDISAWMPKSL